MKLSRRGLLRLFSAIPGGLQAAPAQSGRGYAVAHWVRDLPSVFPPVSHGGPHWVTTSFLFDSLVWKDQEGVVPLLASSWESSRDGRRWTFRLRSGIQWHDGKPLTSRDVAFTFRYLAEHPVPVWSSEATRLLESIEAPDERTVRVTTKAPFPDFLDVVAGALLILPQHIWSNVADPVKYLDPPAFTGSGPYRHQRTVRGEYNLLEANRGYLLGSPLVEHMVLKAVNNPALALRGGDVDAASITSPLAASQFRNDARFIIGRGPFSYYVTKLVFNVTRRPFDNKAVRQAVACALDKEEIVRQALEGEGVAGSSGLLHEDSPWFAPGLPRYGPNRARAEGLLSQAGFSRRGPDGIRLSASGARLSFTLFQRADSPELGRQAELIREQLAAVGIGLTIQAVSIGPLENLMSKGEFDLALDGHGGTNNLQVVATHPDFPAQLYRNPALDDLYRRFTTVTDEARRREFAAGIQRIIAEDVPSIALVHARELVVFRRDKGVRWFWTKGGLGGGAPLWWNKLALLAQQRARRK